LAEILSVEMVNKPVLKRRYIADFCTTALEALAAFATRRTDLTRSSLGKTVMQGVASPTQVSPAKIHYIP